MTEVNCKRCGLIEKCSRCGLYSKDIEFMHTFDVNICLDCWVKNGCNFPKSCVNCPIKKCDNNVSHYDYKGKTEREILSHIKKVREQ